MGDAKEKAKEAKNNAEEARGRALDLLKKVNDISLPNLGFPQLTELTGDQDINVAAERIQKEADKLQLKLEHLENQFNDRKEIIDNSRANAQVKYEKGKVLLDSADKLMAMVHGAKENAQEDNQKINDLIRKAESLYNQLEEFHSNFSPKGATSRSIPDMKNRLDTAEDFYRQLEDHVSQLSVEAERVHNDAQTIAGNANQTKQTGVSRVEEATKLKEDVEDQIKALEERKDKQSEIDATYAAKTDEINYKHEESVKALSEAKTTKAKAELSKKNLQELLDLLKKLKSDDLKQILDVGKTMVDDFTNCENDRECLVKTKQQLEEYKTKFAQIKADQQEKMADLQQKLNSDKEQLKVMVAKKEELQDEVSTLEKIRNVLPNWCQNGGNENK